MILLKTFQKKKKRKIISRLWSLRNFPKRKELVNGSVIFTSRPNNNNNNNIEIEENADEIIEDNIIDNKNMNPRAALTKTQILD